MFAWASLTAEVMSRVGWDCVMTTSHNRHHSVDLSARAHSSSKGPMDKVINHLLQLQELSLAYDEHRQLGGGEHLERLSESIASLTDKLPAAARDQYQRLCKRDRVALAPVFEGSCTMCGMKLPISLVQAINRAAELQHCPSCARIMYASEMPRWAGDRGRRRGAPRKAGISRFSAETLMVPDLKSKDTAGAIRELATTMQRGGFVEDVDKLVDAALDREAILSTAVDCGLAFPHVRGVEGGGLTLALGISRAGIAFDPEDSERSHFIFFSTIPTAVSAFYLKLLAGLTESFVKEPNRETLLVAETPQDLWKALTRATRYTIR